ncbi:hypothetical protein CsSME_00032016 [Camellia sinensis var. sinensis]
MEEGANSWLTRTKFSHTVCHRLDSARLASIPLTIPPNWHSGLKSRPAPASVDPKPGPAVPQIQQNRPINKQRSFSPLPKTTTLSDEFKEAQSDWKRFSTPHPRRREPEKGIVGKLFHKDSQEIRAPDSKSTSSATPLRNLSSMKMHEKLKIKKDSTWTKYFDNGGGRVTSVETADDWMVDLSKLFLGLRFAHGAHSQLYHGIYKDEPVAVKIIRVPDDDENGALGARLEKQFTREVTLLSRLHHQNVIKNLRPAIPAYCLPAMRALIEQCWCSQPEKRPEFWQIVKVLEQFESSLARDGTLNLVQNLICQDHKKGLLHWMQKLGPSHPNNNSPMLKLKFT